MSAGSSSQPNKDGAKMLGCLLAFLLAVCLVMFTGKSADELQAEGYRAGAEDGRSIKATQDYTNDQIDGIVDGVMTEKVSQINSKGSDYAEGWVSGVKDGMRR